MGDLENALDCAEKCRKGDLDKSDGTIVFTTTPLSEMVWSQNSGLRLQYVASGVSEKKASVVWNTESFNIVISSPKRATDDEAGSSKEFVADSLNMLQVKSNFQSLAEQSSSPAGVDSRPQNQIEIFETSTQPSDHCHLLVKRKRSMKASSSSKSADNRHLTTKRKHTSNRDNLNLSLGNSNYLSNKRKGKEQVIYDTEVDRVSVSKSVDSQDSVESCNSKRLTSTSKRPRSHELKTSRVNKRLKKKTDEGSSSFMNWVSTITNGFSRFSEATPLSFALPPPNDREENHKYFSASHVEGKDMGFKSIFKSLYLPNLNVKKVNMESHQVVSDDKSRESSKLVSKDKNEFLQNLWITRFSPKVSSTVEKSSDSMQAIDLAKNCKDQDWFKMRNEKLEAKLSPMLPSNVSSSFAKRLDGWRYPKFPKISDRVTLAAMTTCLFCGKSSHGTKACS